MNNTSSSSSSSCNNFQSTRLNGGGHVDLACSQSTSAVQEVSGQGQQPQQPQQPQPPPPPKRKNNPSIRPLPADKASNDRGTRYPIGLRAQALTLHSIGFHAHDVSRISGIPIRTVYGIVKKARERGYDPRVDPRILDYYVIDGFKAGRPKKNKGADESDSSRTVSTQPCEDVEPHTDQMI